MSIADHESSNQEILWVKREDIPDTLKPKITDWVFWQRLFPGESACFEDDGILINSGKFNQLSSQDARNEITKFVDGKIVTKFKLRDWVFSRQRYWGEPIPIVECEKCGTVSLSEKELPLKLPEVKNYKLTETGESPLANIPKWVNTKCPKCKGPAKRETDTMPNWAGSSWYYLRYCDPKNKKVFAEKKKLKYWTPVDWYNGGMEHTTLHLLYSRFWHKFLYDLKLVPTVEPYKKRTSHGMILGEGGVKMSKSLGNVINPDNIVRTYGADTLRVYEMFLGPFEDSVAWSTESIIGPRRFIEKVWRIGNKISESQKDFSGPRFSSRKALGQTIQNPSGSLSFKKLLHKTIKKVGEDIETMRFNTAVSAMMILTTEMEKSENIDPKDFKKFLQILAPFAPHISEEIWNLLGEKKSINLSKWPKWDEKLIKDEEIKIVVQINGKVRDEILIKVNEDEEDIKKKAIESQAIRRFIQNREIKRIIYVKNRLINVVV
ncbi:class I tRNA ligase family protein [Patescibacteria group bacterium]|nr:class I tRNA ligase family protein [Patescibacteria group bacterium]